MFQEQLLEKLKTELPHATSLNEAIATALDISYDAAHRRSSGKSKFSLEESVRLAKYYNLSLDRLFENTKDDIIAVEKTKPIHNELELQTYFDNSYNSLKPLLNQNESRILYSAKDIPLFYTLESNLLSRFKMFVWLKLLDPTMVSKGFESFSLKVATLQSAKALGSLYQNLNTTEIWDVTTVNSTLKQIHFYKEAGLISNSTALELCKDLKHLIFIISKKVNPSNEQYLFYYNELLLMNNNVLVSTPLQKSLFVPFTILSYYQTSDKITCLEAEDFLKKQLQSSKLLNTAGEKEKLSFFNKIYAKIDALYQLIEATQVLDFE
ncbi:helix-turn-helix domain-containing protein [uncultured Winogradskyella sp.]|uniref:helix-turn-helix domain-containing protein n=1 Tax=uncultured Winogradskyella sp. TaxID=395353 RepID=UPI002613D72D|nr:helix-turn-helix domain-containing protein [uncultured Winogradskyella sp.]